MDIRLGQLRDTVRREAKRINHTPEAYDNVRLALQQIEDEFGTADADQAVRDFKLKRKGFEEAEDYVIATGETHSVKEFVEIAFDRAKLDWKKHVVIDPKFVRPAEVDLLIGDASKAKQRLGWQPRTSFTDLVQLMVDSDLELLSNSK